MTTSYKILIVFFLSAFTICKGQTIGKTPLIPKYHGLRAKDNSFNVTMQTDFDNVIEKINIIPRDIGRVMLNLYNNAFYAVNEKKKSAEDGYVPTVSVSKKK